MSESSSTDRINSINEKVEERLQQQQASKEFKDVGRVKYTRKEKSAYKAISASMLVELEADSIMAYNMIKKDGVWSEIDVKAEKERGVNAGAAYLKVKIREAVPTRPKDDKDDRQTYVSFLERLQADLFDCFTVVNIQTRVFKYSNMTPVEYLPIFFKHLCTDELLDEIHNSSENDLPKELREKIRSKIGWKHYRSFVKGVIEEVFGVRFYNMLFSASDAAADIWHEAKNKEPQSLHAAKEIYEYKLKALDSDLERLLEKAKVYINADDNYLQYLVDTWNFSPSEKREYKKYPEKFRDWVLNRNYPPRIKAAEKAISDFKEAEQPKERLNDWSWFENEDEADSLEVKKPKSDAINTKAKLSYIKRTGGYKIEEISPSAIVDTFGFSAVNYGNYVNDQWSKEHTRHFLGAMCDLGEILNIDIKGANNLGLLAIAFGAKGRKGHLATYFPQSKDINLTRGNGDGSVAHEWGHYFDNVTIEGYRKKSTPVFATTADNYFDFKDPQLGELFDNFKSFVTKGNEYDTPRLPIRFYAKKVDIDRLPTIYSYISRRYEKLEIKPTIEETLASVSNLAVLDDKYYNSQISLYGYIINAFGLEHYDVEFKLKTSYFYHKSRYNYLVYCDKKADGTISTSVSKRTDYWTDIVELFARAFETVVLKKLTDKKRESNYLVSDIPLEDIISENYFKPYPTGKELDHLEFLIDEIVEKFKSVFGVGDFVPPSDVRVESEFVEFEKNDSGKTENAVVVNKLETNNESFVEFVEKGEIVNVVINPKEQVTINGKENTIEHPNSEKTYEKEKKAAISNGISEELFDNAKKQHPKSRIGVYINGDLVVFTDKGSIYYKEDSGKGGMAEALDDAEKDGFNSVAVLDTPSQITVSKDQELQELTDAIEALTASLMFEDEGSLEYNELIDTIEGLESVKIGIEMFD